MLYTDKYTGKLAFSRNHHQLWVQGTHTTKGAYSHPYSIGPYDWEVVNRDDFNSIAELSDKILWNHLEKRVNKKSLLIVTNRAKMMKQLSEKYNIKYKYLRFIPSYVGFESSSSNVSTNIEFWVSWLKARGCFINEQGKKFY